MGGSYNPHSKTLIYKKNIVYNCMTVNINTLDNKVGKYNIALKLREKNWKCTLKKNRKCKPEKKHHNKE